MKKSFLILLTFLLLASCEKDYLDINRDPNSPVVAPNNMLLPGVQVELARWLSIGDGLGSIATVYTHQGTTREHWNDYGVLGTSFYNQQNWTRLYTKLINVETMIAQGEENDELIYKGVAQAIKAYTYSVMVDIWGDIPFSQASNIGEYPHPEFDDDAAIYAQLFTLLDDAIENLEDEESANILRPGADDLIYNGNVEKWIRFANTLKLKLYVQVRNTDLYNATEVASLLAGDMLMEDHDDGFMLFFGTGNEPENRHPGFVQEYAGGQIGLNPSPWFYEIMMGLNPDIFSNIVDPRVPYYFYNQLLAGEEPQNPAEYVHDSQFGRFVSIWDGSIGPNLGFDQRVSATMLGLYPVGGRYSDPTDSARPEGRTAAATGAVPQRMLTYVDRLYLEQELLHVDGVTMDSLTFSTLLEASFDQVDYAIQNAVLEEQDVPSLNRAENDAVDSYINSILGRYAAANNEKKFEILMTQKWISSAGAPIDQYTDIRRTGYPVIHDANTDDNDLTQRLRNYAVSFPWSNNELTLNPNAPTQKDPQTYKIFWDVD